MSKILDINNNLIAIDDIVGSKVPIFYTFKSYSPIIKCYCRLQYSEYMFELLIADMFVEFGDGNKGQRERLKTGFHKPDHFLIVDLLFFEFV